VFFLKEHFLVILTNISHLRSFLLVVFIYLQTFCT